jgi:hypothetical protein
MLSESVDDLIPYVACSIPLPFIAWSWVQWRRQRPLRLGSTRQLLTNSSLAVGSASCLLLVAFPGVLHFLESSNSSMADGWYRHSVQVGFWAALLACCSGGFASGRLRRLILLTSAIILLTWFWVGIGY